MAGESMLRIAGNIDRSGWLGSVGLGSKPTEGLELFVDGFAGVTFDSGAADAVKVTNVNGVYFSQMLNDIQ